MNRTLEMICAPGECGRTEFIRQLCAEHGAPIAREIQPGTPEAIDLIKATERMRRFFAPNHETHPILFLKEDGQILEGHPDPADSMMARLIRLVTGRPILGIAGSNDPTSQGGSERVARDPNVIEITTGGCGE